MTQEIQELLNKIYNDFNIEKFGLKKESRIFLDKLSLNNEYLQEFFEFESDEDIFKFINIIYLDLIEVRSKIDEIKEVAKNSREFEILFIKYFGHNLENLEQEKKNKLKEFIENKFKELIREELPEKWQEIISQEDFNIANIQKDKEDVLRAKKFNENRKETLELYDSLLATINQIKTDKHGDIHEVDEKYIQQVINDFKETNNLNIIFINLLKEKDFKIRSILIQRLKNIIKDKQFQEIKQKYQK